MEILVLLGPVAVMAITQYIKKFYPSVTPLLIAGVLAAVGGVMYALLVHTGYYEAIREFSLLAFSGAVALYEILKKAQVVQ